MTIFTRIINGDIPSYKVAENDRFYAFLDINPLAKGHTLVIPKLAEPEADYIFDLDDQTLADLSVFAKQVAIAMRKVIDCKRIGVAVLGMEVNHVHIHLIPLQKETDMLFSNPKLQLSSEEMAEIANSIAVAFDGEE
ncbi:MAG: HIT family protein [Paludibacter sp.]|nr:HIT family protein [Bacteroidales bacterium]MCM1068484.1 HIT family protein [Prevotella sp.]MCM1353438.1 HIT family protein [Bacteroides sp.]MCM1442599.1 HIT family protein [Muribaculum sp.]MCM1481444.1 HIT family protein [Paludibacter sp.]